MQYRTVKGFSGWGQLGMLCVFTGVGFILSAVVQVVIIMQVAPAGMSGSRLAEEGMKALMLPGNIGYARLLQVLTTFFLFFVPAILFLVVCHGRNLFWLGFNKHINAWQVLIGFFLFLCANVIAVSLQDISKDILVHSPGLNAMARKLENSYNEQVTALSNLKSWGEFIMAILIMAFFPALFEEVFFRGTLQNLLVKWWKAPLIAIIVTSILFSIIHMSVYLFLSRALLGFMLGLMYQRSKNIWVNIIAHFLNNSIVIIQMFLLSRHGDKIEANKLDPKFPIWGGLLAAAITCGLFLLFEKVSVKNRQLISFEEQNLLEKNDPFHSIT